MNKVKQALLVLQVVWVLLAGLGLRALQAPLEALVLLVLLVKQGPQALRAQLALWGLRDLLGRAASLVLQDQQGQTEKLAQQALRGLRVPLVVWDLLDQRVRLAGQVTLDLLDRLD